MISQKHIVQTVTEFYLDSGDFNGFPIREFGTSQRLIQAIGKLVQGDKITVTFGDIHPNPHVGAFDPEPVDQQLEKLERLDLQHACLYPSAAHLKSVVDQSRYRDRPFTLKLALGEPQLRPYSFDLRVLEFYRNDPRYHYETDDISGSISVSDQFYQSQAMRDSDQVLLQTFGFAYNDEMERAVAVFLRYLADLSPEHQQIWNAQGLDGDYRLHPDYYRSSIIGDWPEGVSIFQAFMEELRLVNEMAQLMGRPSFFKKDFVDQGRPRGFSFLVRPTLREFNDFVHLLDKMLSENINRGFFQDEVVFGDGERPGSLTILERWLEQTVRFPDPQPVKEMILAFKEIRRMRQRPAHAVEEDCFDQTYFSQQRELIQGAYGAVRTLRLIFANHPIAGRLQIPEYLQKGRIWTY